MTLSLLSFAACTSTTTPDDGPPPPTDDGTDPIPAHSGLPHSFADPHSGGHSAHSGHSAADPYAGCDADPPVGPFPVTSTDIIRTEEDFDFDGTQYLLTQRNVSMAGITRTGVVDILAGNIGSDAAGIRALPTGDVLVAQPDTGGVRRVNLANGSSVNVLSGLAFPNGLEVSSTGAAFVSEFVPGGRVREFDPYTGDVRVIANIDSPNNMVLSPDERTLYVIATPTGWGPSRIVALDRDGSGGWDPPREVWRANEFLGGIAADLCGDLYLTGFSSGRVVRLRVPELTVEPVADLQSLYGSYSAAHFSPGLAGWSRTELYVTNRQFLYVMDVGVEGRHVLAP